MVAILFFKNVSTVQSKILLEVHKIMFILIGLLQSVQNFWEVYKSIYFNWFTAKFIDCYIL